MDKRFNLNTDKELAYAICEEICIQFWKLEYRKEHDVLSVQMLAERLSSLGYEVSNEKEKTTPYHNYCNKDCFYVAMRNMDFCIEGRTNGIELLLTNPLWTRCRLWYPR